MFKPARSLISLILLASIVFCNSIHISAASYTNGYTGSMPGNGQIYAYGIDVSSWQGSGVDFNRVKNAGYDFVILRCGTTKGKDSTFEANYAKAKAAGMDIGVYYYSYATSVSGAVSDANNVLGWISGKKLEYPVYFDFEDPSQSSLGSSLSAQICYKFLDTMKANGYLPGLYSMASWMEQSWITSSGLRDDYEGWVAHYYKNDGTHSYQDSLYTLRYGMCQYTDSKVVDGAGAVDANVAYKDYPSIVKQYGFNGYSTGNWIQSDGVWYYKDSSGNWVTGWKQISGIWYLFDSSGAMLTGWQQINGIWYYLNDDGAMQIGWIYSGDKWYYTNANGEMQTGWIEADGYYYYADDSGAIQLGFKEIGDKVYYFHPTGTSESDNSIPQGAMLTGWQQISGIWYYFENDGAMKNGWLNQENNWYYLDDNGAMLTGFQKINGNQYYLSDSGVMQTGLLRIDTKVYMFASDGALRYIVADIDSNSNVDANDLIQLKRSILQSTTLSGDALSAADINGDGEISLLDILRLRRYLADSNIKIGQ